MVVAAAAILCATPAAAAPGDPPVEPWVPPVSGIGNPLAQSDGGPAGLLGLPDLAPYLPTMLLGQNPEPQAAGVAAPVTLPPLGAFNQDYLLPQNVAPAAPGEGTPAPGIGPNAEDPGTGRIAFLRRLHEMYQAGALQGALLGQQSPEEFAATQEVIEPPAVSIPN